MKTFAKKSWVGILLTGMVYLSLTAILSSCADQDKLSATGYTEFFVQDFNPANLDILWVVDDRSPMYDAGSKVVPEAAAFFSRLDSAALDYRMGITTMSSFNGGALRPSGTILDKKTGTKDQRVNLFRNFFSQVINLKTAADNQGFAMALQALQTSFIPRANVPLVLVFVSYGDDFSNVTSGMTAEDDYSTKFLALKGNKTDLLKVYSINYITLDSGEDPLTSPKRCAAKDNTDIDKTGSMYKRTDGSNWFQDRYFKLATKLGGDKANLCGSFASLINLDGIKLKTLPKSFKLERTPDLATMKVTIQAADGSLITIPWAYLSTTNEIAFDTTPPAGSTIQVTFN